MKNQQIVDVGDIFVSYESVSSVLPDPYVICHDKYEILYVTSGRGKYVSEGVSFPINARSLFLSRPFEYKTLSLSSDESYSRYTVRFSEMSLSDNARELLKQLISDDGSIYYASGSVLSALDSCFDRLYIAERLPIPERRAFLETLISEMIILLSAGRGECRNVHEDTLSVRVSRYINSNLNRDLNLDNLAKRFFVNKYYLCRAFKSQSGSSIHSYINRKRVLYAKQLIDSGETASRAAYLVGFGDYSAFYRAFVKLYGCSPTSSEIGDIKV